MKARRKRKSLEAAGNPQKKSETASVNYCEGSRFAAAAENARRFFLLKDYKSYLFFILVLFVLPVSFIKIYDCDVWWHMQLGRSMLENFGLPDYSRFYFTPVNHSYSDLRYTWLGDIVLFGLHWLGNDLALQFLVLAVVIFSCYLLRDVCGNKFGWWNLLALMFFVIGTYQKQLVRNSLFALVFATAIFWLWHQVRFQDKEKRIWFFPLLIGLWGCIHGSYLFGFGIAVLIFSGDWIDSIRGANPGRKRLSLQYLSVIVVSFIAISAYNPLTAHYFGPDAIKRLFSAELGSEKIIVKNDKDDSVEASISVSNGENQSYALQTGYFSPSGIDLRMLEDFPERAKLFLNSLLFKPSDTILPSGDFVSPFDMVHRFYIKVCFFMGLAGFVFLTVFSKPIRFSHMFPFLATLVAGMGYVRLAGYIPIVATATIFIAARNGEFTLKINERWAKLLSICALAALYINFASGFKYPIGTEFHSFGAGRIPVFSEESAERILEDFPRKKVFTTIMNGGYLLYEWYPDKKVFIDGFFLPHTYDLLYDYSKLIKGELSADELNRKYGVEIAVVEQTNRELIASFTGNPNWHVRFMDKGTIVYEYGIDDYDSVPPPEILGGERQLAGLPSEFLDCFSENLMLIQGSYAKKGRLKDLNYFRKKYSGLIEKLTFRIDADETRDLDSAIDYYSEIYGSVNTKTIQYEMLHIDAFKRNDFDLAVEYGLMVLEEMPERPLVLVNLSVVFAKRKEIAKSIEYLDRAFVAREKDLSFWNENRAYIARHCTELAGSEKSDVQFLSAYKLFGMAYNIDSSIISKEKLYETGMGMAKEKSSEGISVQGYEILKKMEVDFPEDGIVYNNIAWLILTNRNMVFDGPEVAKDYAKKAVRLLERDENPFLYLAYNTMAEACYQVKDYESMRIYEEKALSAAPDQMKKGYRKHSVEQEQIK